MSAAPEPPYPCSDPEPDPDLLVRTRAAWHEEIETEPFPQLVAVDVALAVLAGDLLCVVCDRDLAEPDAPAFVSVGWDAHTGATVFALR